MKVLLSPLPSTVARGWCLPTRRSSRVVSRVTVPHLIGLHVFSSPWYSWLVFVAAVVVVVFGRCFAAEVAFSANALPLRDFRRMLLLPRCYVALPADALPLRSLTFPANALPSRLLAFWIDALLPRLPGLVGRMLCRL